jgi:hypothetical protein
MHDWQNREPWPPIDELTPDTGPRTAARSTLVRR